MWVLLIHGSCWEFSAGDPAAVVTVYVSDHVYDCMAPTETVHCIRHQQFASRTLDGIPLLGNRKSELLPGILRVCSPWEEDPWQQLLV